MTEKQHKIPLKDVAPPTPKKNERIKGITSFLLILIGVAIFFMSPIPSYLLSFIPNSFTKMLFSGVYEEVVIDDLSFAITKPQRITNSHPFPVLGRDTGLCFSFTTQSLDNNEGNIHRKILEGTKRGKIIAEIIAVSKGKEEYPLDKVTSYTIDDKVIICQKFSKKFSIIPDEIKDIYIRPIETFIPNKVVWRTMKNVY